MIQADWEDYLHEREASIIFQLTIDAPCRGESHGVSTSMQETTRCCTQSKIGLVVMVDEVSQHAMEVADKSRTVGIEVVPTTTLDPYE